MTTEYNFLEPAKRLPDQTYPIEVIYCEECSMPIEYCEYGPCYDLCKKWLQRSLPEEFERLNLDESDLGAGKKSQSRGGKGMVKIKKKADDGKIYLTRASRGKKKFVTVITGLSTFGFIHIAHAFSVTRRRAIEFGMGLCREFAQRPIDRIDLKDASKFFGSRLACGCSVTGADELVIQGDVRDDLCDIMPDKWKSISEDAIEIKADQKR